VLAFNVVFVVVIVVFVAVGFNGVFDAVVVVYVFVIISRVSGGSVIVIVVFTYDIPTVVVDVILAIIRQTTTFPFNRNLLHLNKF